MNLKDIYTNFFYFVASSPDQHAPGTKAYEFLKNFSASFVKPCFTATKNEPVHFGDFGEIEFPFFEMGTVNSTNLFDIDELILFSFYLRNRHKYRKVLDLGANIGLHSLLLAKLGMQIKAFEPDERHIAAFRSNMAANKVEDFIELVPTAISDVEGKTELVRVLGNTTGNHLVGAKENVYGDLEKIEIETKNISDYLDWPDLIKMDVEGHEARLIVKFTATDFDRFDLVLEIGSIENRKKIFSHINEHGVNMFAQKIGWEKVSNIDDAPCHYKEGSVFISKEKAMPW